MKDCTHEKSVHKSGDRSNSLVQELCRKEKALADTAALLFLRKKADAIWGETRWLSGSIA